MSRLEEVLLLIDHAKPGCSIFQKGGFPSDMKDAV